MAMNRTVEDVKTVKQFPYPAIDFKFANRGHGTAFLWQFGLEIIRAEVDVTPALEFSYELGKRHNSTERDSATNRYRREPNYISDTLTFVGTNNGWGDAINCTWRLSSPQLERLFPEQKLHLRGHILSGEDAFLGSLGVQDAKADAIEDSRELMAERRLLIERVINAMKTSDLGIMSEPSRTALLSKHELWHLAEFFRDLSYVGASPQDARQQWHIAYFENEDRSDVFAADSEQVRSCVNGLPIHEIEARGACKDERGQAHNVNTQLASSLDRGDEGELWFTEQGFCYLPFYPPAYALRPSEVVYICIVDPEAAPREKKYPISVSIPAGDVARFHVVVGATKSAKLQVRLKFYVDRSDIVMSSLFDLGIWWPRNSEAYDDYRDGQFFVPLEGGWTLAGPSREPRW